VFIVKDIGDGQHTLVRAQCTVALDVTGGAINDVCHRNTWIGVVSVLVYDRRVVDQASPS
jgi:hypothetical protein